VTRIEQIFSEIIPFVAEYLIDFGFRFARMQSIPLTRKLAKSPFFASLT